MHQHINTVPNYVSPLVCEAIINNVSIEHVYEQGIMVINDDTPTNDFIIDRESRFVYSCSTFKQPEFINGIIQTIVSNVIEVDNQCEVDYWEYPQLLKYVVGGHYGQHCDAETYNEETQVWKRVTNRHLSLLLYLDAEYEGGELVFPKLNMVMTPKPGQIIVFPSNSNYVHGVRPLLSGTRHVLVCWLTVKGEPTVTPKPHGVVTNHMHYGIL